MAARKAITSIKKSVLPIGENGNLANWVRMKGVHKISNYIHLCQFKQIYNYIFKNSNNVNSGPDGVLLQDRTVSRKCSRGPELLLALLDELNIMDIYNLLAFNNIARICQCSTIRKPGSVVLEDKAMIPQRGINALAILEKQLKQLWCFFAMLTWSNIFLTLRTKADKEGI
jgi:hypothetical protein